ncbi:MAG TPA: Crp/Fnr family transcriptional regulator [Saprospiraceae bacterium]|nr:Crp/Fnr family transcriptional regulator [Saprospiraceae bacterium]HNM24499.1 Crp/Fnr family transcriptional regulator [Saprospiraceae bacterium]
MPPDPSEQLLAFLQRVSALSRADALTFASAWQLRRQMKRGDYLCAPGKVEQHVWFVAKGLFRIYYPTEQEEICAGFAYEDTMISSFPSFVRQTPSVFSIQALEKCTVLGIARSDLYAAIERWPAVSRLWSGLLEQVVAGLIEREIEISTTTPEQRYHNLMARAPYLFQRVPLKHIASYLRIKPETLSRVRAGALPR